MIAPRPLPRPRTKPLIVPQGGLKRRKWSREMTIAAGFVCTNGIVMCADSQESSGDYKFPVEKLLIRETESIQAVLAGAGHGPMIDMASGRVFRSLMGRELDNYDDAEAAIADELVALYEREFSLCPVSEPEDRIIELLIGLKIRKLGDPVLFKTFASTVSQVPKYAIIGSGRAIEYQLHKLYRWPEKTNRVIPIALSLLNVAGVVLRSVGGEARLAVLNEGEKTAISIPLSSEVDAVKRAQSDLESAAGQVLLDLLDVAKSDDDFRATLMEFSSLAIELRVSRLTEHENFMVTLRSLMRGWEGGKGEPMPSTPQTLEGQQ
jgi:hypothetical protein